MVSRRQLLKLSALSTASFAAPLAYSASNITMTHNTGYPIGSTSPKDLTDNTKNLDLFLNGDNPLYPDRNGVPRKSWKGMEGEFNAGQAHRETVFVTDQDKREVKFSSFLDASGYEAPVPYASGFSLVRPTQTITYLGKEYRAKSAFLPLITTSWVVDESKLKLVGDDALRQDVADSSDPKKGARMIGFSDRLAPSYLKTVSDILNAGSVSVMRFISRDEHAALYAGDSEKDYTTNINEAFASMINGGELTLPPVTFNTTGLEFSSAHNLKITGMGWKSVIKNNSRTCAHGIWVRGDIAEDRTYGLDISSLTLEGNPASGDGLRLDRLGWYDVDAKEASVTNINKLKVMNSGKNGIQVGRNSTEGAGNSVNIIGSVIRCSGRTGIVGVGQTNMINVLGCNITLSARDGVELNQVASTNAVTHTLIADNKRYGVYAFRCEQPMITHNGFNRNGGGGLAFSGVPLGSIKYTEAGLIFANLFGANGKLSTSSREVSIYASKGINILANYFYGTGQKSMIYLGDYAEGIAISGNHFKDLTTEAMLEIKSGVVGTTYTFDDDVDESNLRNIMSNKVVQHVVESGASFLQTRNSLSDLEPRFIIDGDGAMSWGAGNKSVDVSLRRVTPEMITCSGGIQASTLMVADGISTPSAVNGYARLFLDSSDGQLKIRMPNGDIRTFTFT